MEKKVILKKVFHRDKWRMLITFNYDESLVALVKKINSNRYSSTYKSWYVDAFHPVKYLFEGQSGGRYSVESVYRVFKQALHRAGIKKDVGVHSLRHSYATHLHESGLDIRYIQELLGYRSTRTTEIYTHVSRRNLIQVRSPIEDMDLK
jgi:Site-specific recombinase XerD